MKVPGQENSDFSWGPPGNEGPRPGKIVIFPGGLHGMKVPWPGIVIFPGGLQDMKVPWPGK